MYVIARTKSDRPSAQHEVRAGHDTETLCGVDMTGWSRYYMHQKLAVIYCRRCGKTRLQKQEK